MKASIFAVVATLLVVSLAVLARLNKTADEIVWGSPSEGLQCGVRMWQRPGVGPELMLSIRNLRTAEVRITAGEFAGVVDYISATDQSARMVPHVWDNGLLSDERRSVRIRVGQVTVWGYPAGSIFEAGKRSIRSCSTDS